MATKTQVLELLAEGLSPQQIAQRLKCRAAYVRATRSREFGNGVVVDQRHRSTKREKYLEARRQRYLLTEK